MKMNPTAPVVTVREVTDAELPPVPDHFAIRAWLDCNGDGPKPEGIGAGHYQHLVLNTRTGELAFHCSDYRGDFRRPGFYPDAVLFAPSHWEGVPAALYWVIDSGVDERLYHDAAEGNAFAHDVVPLAQLLLDTLLPVPGTEELDWSAEAASAGLDIDRACGRDREAPEGKRRWLVALGEAVHPFPELIRPDMADATDTALDDEAARLSRLGLGPIRNHFPDLAGYYEVDPKDARRFHAGLVGTRAYLYQYRIDQAQGRRPVAAARWLSDSGRLDRSRLVTADTDDAGLERVARDLQEEATGDGIKLIAPVAALRAYRAGLRQALVDELPLFAEARDEAEGSLKRYRAAVTGRLAQIISWGDPDHSNNDAELGRRALLTRQAVNKLRTSIEEPDGPGADDQPPTR